MSDPQAVTEQAAVGGGTAAAETRMPMGTAARLGMMIGEDRVLVELTDAGEIALMPSYVVPVPLSHDWLLGLTNLRGSLYTVCDLRRFLGGKTIEFNRETRLLSMSDSFEFNACIVISRMLGLRNTASMLETHVPASGTGPFLSPSQHAEWLGRCFTDAEGHAWRELSLARLAKSPEFLLVGR